MNAIRFIAISMIVAIIMISVASCGTAASGVPLSLSIVAGNHANIKALNPAGTAIVQLVSEATASCGAVSIVCADGDPKVSGAWTISPPSAAGLAESKLKQISTQQAKAILANLSAVKASAPEVDMIKALDISVRGFAEAPENSDRQILVLDSGLPTSGELNFTKSDLINAAPSAISDLLSSRNAIPNFSGITVTWIGLADVCVPQKELSPAKKESLKNIWTAVIEKTGGRVVFLDTLPSNDDNLASDFPRVSTIDFLGDHTDAIGDVDAIVFRSIQFKGDSAEYVDPKAAEEIIKPVADYMKATPDFSLLIVGTTAGDNSKAYCIRLSTARAETVKNTLISMGVSADRIKAVGLGYSDTWHIPDTSDDGTLIESVAAQNRKTVLMNAVSADAQSILAANN